MILILIVYLIGVPIAFRIAWSDFNRNLKRKNNDLMDIVVQLYMSAMAAVVWPIFAVLLGIASLIRRSRTTK